jgi:SAM-dependent methyltransferase
MGKREDIERTVRRCYSTWGARYYEDYYQSDGAYPPVHTDIIRNLLQSCNARSVIDAGCGPASMLRDLALPNLARYGFDLTPEMTAEARRVLGAQGVPASNIWEGSVLDEASFKAPDPAAPALFDAAICFGVIPHIPEDSDPKLLAHLATAVRPGGLVACEARNMLFALFTLNRYSRELFTQHLIREDELVARTQAPADREKLNEALARLDGHFRLDVPPVRKGYEDEPGYDEVLSRTHNPFVLQAHAEQAGLVDVQVLFYHYHALPPMLAEHVPELFRRESLAMENPFDWRGHFMASAFILTARKP